jgi:hypothetical protein
MQEPEVGWDPLHLDYRIGLTTKLTALYLVISTLVFVISAIRFLRVLAQFRTSVATLRAPDIRSRDIEGQDIEAAAAPRRRFEMARLSIQVALTNLRKWTKLTLLILLGYSTTEIADLLRGMSLRKMTGISALSGSLESIFTMWSLAAWFLAALCIASWILSDRLARSTDVQLN